MLTLGFICPLKTRARLIKGRNSKTTKLDIGQHFPQVLEKKSTASVSRSVLKPLVYQLGETMICGGKWSKHNKTKKFA